jgi:hypothetical protein
MAMTAAPHILVLALPVVLFTLQLKAVKKVTPLVMEETEAVPLSLDLYFLVGNLTAQLALVEMDFTAAVVEERSRGDTARMEARVEVEEARMMLLQEALANTEAPEVTPEILE